MEENGGISLHEHADSLEKVTTVINGSPEYSEILQPNSKIKEIVASFIGLCAIIIIFFNLGRSSRDGRQKLILEIIALMVNHPSGYHQQSSRAVLYFFVGLLEISVFYARESLLAMIIKLCFGRC